MNRPSIYLDEVRDELFNMTGTYVHLSHNLPHCPISWFLYVALQCDDKLRGRFMAEASIFDPDMLVWVDESGFKRKNTIRTYGYGIRGLPAKDHRLRHS